MIRKTVLALANLLLCGSLAHAEQPAVSMDETPRITRGSLVMEGIPEIPADISARRRQYSNLRGHGFLDWTENGLLISTRFGEVSQIHQIEQPLGMRRQLTFYDEPVGGALADPDGDRFVFTKDTGGDEFYQGFYFDTETGKVSQFTEPGVRNGAFVWSDDGEHVAWYRASDGDPDYDLFVGDPERPESARLVYEGTGALYPVDFSSDGRKLAVQQYLSISKSRIFILDIETSNWTEFNADDDVAYSGAVLLNNGDVLTVSDKDSEFANLVRYDAETGAVTNYTAGLHWDVESWDVSADEKLVVFTVNEGGLGAIRLLDLETGESRMGPELPVGIASGPIIHPDGTQVGFTFNGATNPYDVWSFDIASLELTRWSEAEIGGLDADGFVAPELFDYPNDDGYDIPAFIYRPEGEGPFPAIISIHGGPEAQSRPRFSSTYQYWVNELGIAVIVPNVRGSSGYGKTYVALDNGLNRKKSVEDIGALLDWVDTQADLDAERVVVFGGSYGGYMVLASMIDYADRLAGGVDIVGISDFATFLNNTKGYRRDLRRAEYGDERDPEIAAFFDEISPLKNAAGIDKPLFIIQGYNDPRVPYTEAEQILAAVRANETTAWFLMAMDEGHGFRKKSNRDFQVDAETLFLRDVLGLD